MTPEERAMETLREIITAARSKGADEAVQIYLAAIREAVKAEREECAKIADDDASLIAPMLAGASRRYAVREALHDLGYQGDPDAEIISLEAAKGMAEGLAAAIRARTP